MAKSGRDPLTVSPRHVRNHAAAAASGKPHGATFGNAAPKPKGAPMVKTAATGSKAGFNKKGNGGAFIGGSK